VIFDPFGWLQRYLQEETIHRSIRYAMVALLAGFLIHRFFLYPSYALKPLWFVETLIFAILIIAFLLRTSPRDRSRGVREIIIPLIGGVLPFALLLSPPYPAVLGHRSFFYGVLWGMTGATTLTIAGMWALRRSFSITVEARRLVTTGPYRFIRHPIYLGEILAAAGVAIIRLSLANGIILGIFIVIQLLRARWEEKKLVGVFPEYGDFAAQTWWFWK
jgi:protein-S-isoprenylcysteine O-methyltransferase Ste14